MPQASPGAHVDVTLNDEFSRSYSLTKELTVGPYCTVAIHRDPDSRGGSEFVHDSLRVGDKVKISRPKNHFPLDAAADVSVLIAGGIGITPILAMIRHLTEAGRTWRLYYAARKRSAAAFRQTIDACAEASDGKGEVHYHFDDEKEGALIDLRSILAATPNAHFYCCGPEPMLAAFEEAAMGVPREQIHVEYFTATEEAARDGGFEVVLQRSGKTLYVELGQTILDVLIVNNVTVPFSCTEGACGTCETTVLEGRPDHRDMILTEDERAKSETMMVCCSGSRSERLVLDL